MDFHATLSRDRLCFSWWKICCETVVVIINLSPIRLSPTQASRCYSFIWTTQVLILFSSSYIRIHTSTRIALTLDPLWKRQDWNIIWALCITRWGW